MHTQTGRAPNHDAVLRDCWSAIFLTVYTCVTSFTIVSLPRVGGPAEVLAVTVALSVVTVVGVLCANVCPGTRWFPAWRYVWAGLPTCLGLAAVGLSVLRAAG